MKLNFEFIMLCCGLYYLKRWTAGKVMHHPEWQTMDTLDRMLHWVFVVAAIWLCVGLISHSSIPMQLANDIGTGLENAMLPEP